MLIDGFANGWRIDPATLGSAVHDGTITVALQWKPQQRVDLALVISLVAIVACLVLVFLPVRRRRRRGGRHSRGRRKLVESEVGVGSAEAEGGACRLVGSAVGSSGGVTRRGPGGSGCRGIG